MIIDRAAFEACLAHLIDRARAGEEGVGLLSGPRVAPARAASGLLTNQTADRWTPLNNVADSPRYRYEVDPGALLAAYNALEADDQWPHILVHSHLAGGTVPSFNDMRYATNPALLHMIVDLEPQRPHAVLWRLTPGTDPLKIRYQVADLRKQESSATDLTRDVSGG